MEDYDYLLSDHSSNEEAYYSDHIDSDIEAELYGLIHHDPQDNSVSLQGQSNSVESNSVSLQDHSDFVESNSVSLQGQSDSVERNSVSLEDKSGSTENNSILLQNSLDPTDNNSVLLLINSITSADTVNSTKKQKNSLKKKKKKCSKPGKNTHTNNFFSDTVVNNNLYMSFESPVQKPKAQNSQVQSENSKRNKVDTPAKRKSDVVSEILGNIQKKSKNLKSMQSENSVSNLKKNKYDHNPTINQADSFVEVIDDSSENDSDSSVIFFEPDELNLQMNISQETVVLSSDSEDSDSSMEKSFSRACQRKQAAIAIANGSPNNTDPWYINSEDKFRTKNKQSNRYHENAVITCSKCHLKGHSAKFCSVPKAMKCFFCGDYHAGQHCKNKICTKCFHQGHDRRRCYIRYVDTCELCRMRGHSEKNCPDLWRRYHLTISKGRIVKGNPNPHSPLYCYNCGSKGHYGAECMVNPVDRWSFPTWTSVISYKNPIPLLQKEREKDFHERSKFDRTPETSIFDRTPRTRIFERTPETRIFNRTPETRIFNRTPETNQFNRTPGTSKFNRAQMFRRRKENETFSNGTPTQNTKKKKNKKSKTPPIANHQSISNVKSTVRDDVYFPRTPKMTPRASTVHLSKKKYKKLKNKGDHIIRQQIMHRIGLQQRLGLPFSSTV